MHIGPEIQAYFSPTRVKNAANIERTCSPYFILYFAGAMAARKFIEKILHAFNSAQNKILSLLRLGVGGAVDHGCGVFEGDFWSNTFSNFDLCELMGFHSFCPKKLLERGLSARPPVGQL